MNKVKLVDLPDNAMEFKIIQLFHNSEPVMLCGTRQLGRNYFHSKILEKYLKENKIEFDTFAPDPRFPKMLIPSKELSDVYNVVGAGYAGIDKSICYFQLPYGKSKDYDIGVDKDFNMMIKETFMQMPGNWFEGLNQSFL